MHEERVYDIQTCHRIGFLQKGIDYLFDPVEGNKQLLQFLVSNLGISPHFLS